MQAWRSHRQANSYCQLQPVDVGGGQAGSAHGILQFPPQVGEVVAEDLLAVGGDGHQLLHNIIYKELARRGETQSRPTVVPFLVPDMVQGNPTISNASNQYDTNLKKEDRIM